MSGAPGVTCAKCLGRITPENFATSRKIREKLRPGEPFRPPRVCSDCILLAIVTMVDGSDPEPEDWGIWITQEDQPVTYTGRSYWWQGRDHRGDHVMSRSYAEHQVARMRASCPTWSYEARPYPKTKRE